MRRPGHARRREVRVCHQRRSHHRRHCPGISRPRWDHVACHCTQHAAKPFESWFAMGDGKRTLCASPRSATPTLVWRSCRRAIPAGRHLDTGRGAVAHQVVTRFYKEVFKRPVIDFEHTATVLNTTVVESVEKVSLETQIVFVHVGVRALQLTYVSLCSYGGLYVVNLLLLEMLRARFCNMS